MYARSSSSFSLYSHKFQIIYNVLSLLLQIQFIVNIPFLARKDWVGFSFNWKYETIHALVLPVKRVQMM